MLKRLALKYLPMALLLILIGVVIYMSHYAESRKTENKENAEACSSKTAISPNDTGESTQKTDNPKHPPNWIKAFAWPDGVTVWALLLTLLVIAWQSTETRAAAQSAERQIGLQSTAMRQWVNIEPIKTVTPPTFDNPVDVSLQFEVRNKTDYLITLKKIVAEAFHGGVAKTFTVDCSIAIPPGKSTDDGGHPFYVKAFVDRSTWGNDGAMIAVGGEVAYVDCMEIERTQPFQDLFMGYEDGRLSRIKPAGLVPEIADYKPKEERNKRN
ncbi:MAG TPA: hypothetical protein VFK06_19450 [Candidatus Angelobacter sp.]|nr:hypothetical protein [Candidatus Angelobacter sp.]